MILSCPTDQGYAYFEAITITPRCLAPGRHTIPIEATAPLLPIGAKPIATGKTAIGVICYPQTADQAHQIATLPPIKRIEGQEEDDFNFLSALIKGFATTVILKGIL